MARLDVHKLKGTKQLVIDCQTDLLDHISSRFVVPLVPADSLPLAAKQLNPIFAVNDVPHVMLTQSAAAVAHRELGPVLVSLAEHDREILNALDFLLTGA